MTSKKNTIIEIIETTSVLIVSISMFLYGIGKIVQFKDAYNDNLNKVVSELSGLELMWTFYGYSQKLAIIIGVFEIIGALLILINKTRLIGAILLSSILINIIIQDIVFDIPALNSALFYQSLILLILWINKQQLITILNAILIKKSNYKSKTALIYGSSILLFVLVKLVEVSLF